MRLLSSKQNFLFINIYRVIVKKKRLMEPIINSNTDCLAAIEVSLPGKFVMFFNKLYHGSN